MLWLLLQLDLVNRIADHVRIMFGSVPHCKWGFTCVSCICGRQNSIVMTASRLLHAVAACVILLSFAAGLRKSYWSGCMKAATVICQQIYADFLHFGASDFPSKNPFQNRLFFALASRSGFGATISDAVARSSIVF